MDVVAVNILLAGVSVPAVVIEAFAFVEFALHCMQGVEAEEVLFIVRILHFLLFVGWGAFRLGIRMANGVECTCLLLFKIIVLICACVVFVGWACCDVM